MTKEELDREKSRIFHAKHGGKIIKQVDYLVATYEEKKLIKRIWDNKIMFDSGFDAAVELLSKKENENE